MSEGALGERLVEAGLRADQNQFHVVQLAGAFAAGDEWVVAGYSTPGRWIADRLDIALRTANEWIRVGRALGELPVTSAALRSNQISYAKAKVLTRTARPTTEQALLDLACQVSAAELPKAIAWWSRRNEPDPVVDDRYREQRGLRWQVDFDGSIVGSFRLGPAEGGVLAAAVDAQVMRRNARPEPRCGWHDGAEEQAWPSLAQQRADALVELLAGSDDGQGGQAVARYEVVFHVRGDGCSLDDGTPLTESSVARLLPDSFVRLLIYDAGRNPINASGRQRHPTTRQQRVVKARDRACVDCGSHDLLEYDHVPAYEETGHTIVDELKLRCAPCHHFRHRRQGS